uniref:Uncharacterized protein n=1 Tax=Eutreptiella gymnastica TaxID=73025 RepID=A0A7S1JCV4_9EUGL
MAFGGAPRGMDVQSKRTRKQHICLGQASCSELMCLREGSHELQCPMLHLYGREPNCYPTHHSVWTLGSNRCRAKGHPRKGEREPALLRGIARRWLKWLKHYSGRVKHREAAKASICEESSQSIRALWDPL